MVLFLWCLFILAVPSFLLHSILVKRSSIYRIRTPLQSKQTKKVRRNFEEMEGKVVMKSRFKSVCVFCGSSTGKRDCYRDAAIELAQELVLVFFFKLKLPIFSIPIFRFSPSFSSFCCCCFLIRNFVLCFWLFEKVSKRLDLVYGGGSIGLMGLVSQAVHRGGGNVLGWNTNLTWFSHTLYFHTIFFFHDLS